MKSLYFTFFQTYLNYGNITWCISSMTKVKKSCSKRTFNDIWRLVRFENREFDDKNRYSRHLQIKYLPQKKIMFRLKNNTILEAFENKTFIIIITQQGIANITSLNQKYILKLPHLQYLYVDHISEIALQINIQKQYLQPHFLKEKLKTIWLK